MQATRVHCLHTAIVEGLLRVKLHGLAMWGGMHGAPNEAPASGGALWVLQGCQCCQPDAAGHGVTLLLKPAKSNGPAFQLPKCYSGGTSWGEPLCCCWLMQCLLYGSCPALSTNDMNASNISGAVHHVIGL